MCNNVYSVTVIHLVNTYSMSLIHFQTAWVMSTSPSVQAKLKVRHLCYVVCPNIFARIIHLFKQEIQSLNSGRAIHQLLAPNIMVRQLQIRCIN